MSYRRLKPVFICKCGLENMSFQDWIAHWKYGEKRPISPFGQYPKIRAIWLFLQTRIEWR